MKDRSLRQGRMPPCSSEAASTKSCTSCSFNNSTGIGRLIPGGLCNPFFAASLPDCPCQRGEQRQQPQRYLCLPLKTGPSVLPNAHFDPPGAFYKCRDTRATPAPSFYRAFQCRRFSKRASGPQNPFSAYPFPQTSPSTWPLPLRE